MLKVALLVVGAALLSVISTFWMFNGILAGITMVSGMAMRAIAALVRGFAALRMAVLMVDRALLANPIGIAVAAIAAYAIYRNWEPVKAWFQRLWDGIRMIFGGFAKFVTAILTGDMGGAVDGLK